MSNVKERLWGAITVMPEADAQRLWDIVTHLYDEDAWIKIEEEEPDEIDLQMIRDIEANPDCQTFATEEEVRELFAR